MRLIRLLPFAMPVLVAFLGYSGCQDTAQVLEKLPVSSLATHQSPLDDVIGTIANDVAHDITGLAGQNNYGQGNLGQGNFGQGGFGQGGFGQVASNGVGQVGYPQNGYPQANGQVGYQGQAGYGSQAPYGNQAGYQGQAGYQSQAGYPNQQQYGDQAPSANNSYGQAQGYPQQQVPVSATAASNRRIRVGSFNIQVFGDAKIAEANVMQALAQVVLNFDVLAIQEIRSKNDNLMNQFMQYVNQQGAHYSYVIGTRLGRTVSKEQYAFIYNTQTIAAAQNQSYTVNDDQDLLQREPFVARFKVLGTGSYAPFTFTMADVHTDPDEAIQEVTVLGHVYQALQAYEWSSGGEDDVIMVGDFNASAKQITAAAGNSGLVCTITNVPTNTRQTEQYDNILLTPQRTSEFTGNCGVFDLGSYFKMSQADLLKISDHFPVWAEFSAYEANNISANAGRRRY